MSGGHSWCLTCCLSFSLSYKALDSQTPTCPQCSATFSISSCLILSHPVTLDFSRSHLLLFSAGLSKDCPPLPSTGSNFLSTEASFSDPSVHSWHYKHGSSASAQIPLSAGPRAMGLMLCGYHTFLITLAALLWIKSSSVEKAVSGTWRLSSSPVLPPLVLQCLPSFPILIPVQWPSPIPTLTYQGAWVQVLERQTQARCLWRSAHRLSPCPKDYDTKE